MRKPIKGDVPEKQMLPRKTRMYPLPVRKLHDAFRRHEAAAIDKLDLATAYINDGAYSSGAICLHAAAEEFTKAQAARNDALNMLTQHDVKAKR